jgi:hypothetical protein
MMTANDHYPPINLVSRVAHAWPTAIIGLPNKPLTRRYAAKTRWARRGSNPHALRRQGLSPLCLPVSPRALIETTWTGRV